MDKKAVLNIVFSRLASGQNIALIASNRSRATTLLQAIGQPGVYSPWLPDAPHWVFAYLAAEQMCVCNTPVELWRLIWRTLAAQADQQPWRADLEKLSTEPTMKADRALRRIAAQQGKLVLLFDQIDELAKRPDLFTPDFLAPLRSWSSRYANFNIVLSSSQPLSALNRLHGGLGSPFFNAFFAISLDELEPVDI